ncbi:OsmC family protein [Niveibacterium sp. 24ML]|uniref:OsmC family protein n=1 Tax=Niveibacterium sp. 24ML TaxID=2985512 RepID=UPI0022705C55|nr:OsmC family protein [Niveibacterium sp. 24ML]MCX9155242.1 OsmC family protein [Niveibacterium sp. 24ML]
MSDAGFKLRLTQQKDYQFLVEFLDTEIPPVTTDEPPPLGENAGPNPSRMLAAAVSNCLAASLMFALRKFKNEPDPVTVDVEVSMARNESKRLRVGAVDVAIKLGKPGASFEHLDRVLAQFEEFCVVTQSVRDGFAVNVTVSDSEDVVLKA